jgi:hypothetical protein
MTMVGDMFNNSLKAKLDAICTELAAYVAETPSTDRNRGREGGKVSYRSMRQCSDWWPGNLGTPSAVGAQNNLQYAVFPGTRRLAIKDGDRVEIYDTGNHRIFGVAQAQSTDQTLTFTSQDGLVRVSAPYGRFKISGGPVPAGDKIDWVGPSSTNTSCTAPRLSEGQSASPYSGYRAEPQFPASSGKLAQYTR